MKRGEEGGEGASQTGWVVIKGSGWGGGRGGRSGGRAGEGERRGRRRGGGAGAAGGWGEPRQRRRGEEAADARDRRGGGIPPPRCTWRRDCRISPTWQNAFLAGAGRPPPLCAQHRCHSLLSPPSRPWTGQRHPATLICMQGQGVGEGSALRVLEVGGCRMDIFVTPSGAEQRRGRGTRIPSSHALPWVSATTYAAVPLRSGGAELGGRHPPTRVSKKQ